MAKPKAIQRPTKPRADFPLFPHATGYWAKKVRGKLRYFGKIASDPKGQAALARWLEQRDDLLSGRVPRVKVEGLTVRDLCNRFLSSKKDLLDAGEINPHTFAELYATSKRIGDAFGWDRPISDVVADDFDALRRAIAKQWGPVRFGNEVGRIRGVFKYGYDAGLILQPVRFGPTFRKPGAKVLRIERAKRGSKMIEATDLRRVIDAAPMPLNAMILLGLNCGFGNTDVASLTRRAVDLKHGWIDFSRAKTGVPRRCPLWPETVAAIREALASRPDPRTEKYGELIFLTSRGIPWRRSERVDKPDGEIRVKANNQVGKAFSASLKDLGLHRPGLGFYSLRHIFETIAGDSRDQVAVDAVMGHSRNDMASAYRERIEDARLLAVVEHVRSWLFGETETS